MSTLDLWRGTRWSILLVGLLGLCLSLGSVAVAQEAESSEAVAVDPSEDASSEEAAEADLGVGYALDNAFLFIAAVMVFSSGLET